MTAIAVTDAGAVTDRRPGGRRGWTRGPDLRWTSVALTPDTGAMVRAAVSRVFPAAVLHSVTTDVMGPHRARLVTTDGRRLTVDVDSAFQVTGWWAESAQATGSSSP